MPNNVCASCLTAAAGTELARTYSLSTVIIFLNKRALQRYCCPFLTLELSLGQAFAHCPIFLTAALRGSLNLVSVPTWLAVLPYQLKIISLAKHLPYQLSNVIFYLQFLKWLIFGYSVFLSTFVAYIPIFKKLFRHITHPYATQLYFLLFRK